MPSEHAPRSWRPPRGGGLRATRAHSPTACIPSLGPSFPRAGCAESRPSSSSCACRGRMRQPDRAAPAARSAAVRRRRSLAQSPNPALNRARARSPRLAGARRARPSVASGRRRAPCRTLRALRGHAGMARPPARASLAPARGPARRARVGPAWPAVGRVAPARAGAPPPCSHAAHAACPRGSLSPGASAHPPLPSRRHDCKRRVHRLRPAQAPGAAPAARARRAQVVPPAGGAAPPCTARRLDGVSDFVSVVGPEVD